MARRLVALVLLAVLALAVLVAGVIQARERPELALSGGGPVALAVALAAGIALALGAFGCARRREPALADALLVACSGVGLRTLSAPPDGALLFTLALVGAGVAPAAAHAALLHPGGRLAVVPDRIAAAGGYVVHVGVGGLLLALVFAPSARAAFTVPPTCCSSRAILSPPCGSGGRRRARWRWRSARWPRSSRSASPGAGRRHAPWPRRCRWLRSPVSRSPPSPTSAPPTRSRSTRPTEASGLRPASPWGCSPPASPGGRCEALGCGERWGG